MSPPIVHLALLEPASCMLKDLDKGQCLQLEEGRLSASSIRVCIKLIFLPR